MANLPAEFKPVLSLEDLAKELSQLEAGSFIDLTDEQLNEKLRLIHAGFRIHAPIYKRGTLVYRAVRVTDRPSHLSRVGYPPLYLATANGRCNRAGEVVFYGALRQFVSCLFECAHRVGEFFSVSAWLTRTSITLNHLGYSQSVFDQIKSRRELPQFAAPQVETQHNKLIREWQARVFTARVPEGQEHLYRLPLALRDLALSGIATSDPHSPSAFSGIVYPSVAMWLLADNVALLPQEVDTKLKLFEVMLLVIDDIKVAATPDGGQNIEHRFRVIDIATPDKSGNLLWGQQTRLYNPEGVPPPLPIDEILKD
jgi:hypothetical protein